MRLSQGHCILFGKFSENFIQIQKIRLFSRWVKVLLFKAKEASQKPASLWFSVGIGGDGC